MTRSFPWLAGLMLLVGCGADAPGGPSGGAPSDWVAPPRLEVAVVDGAEVRLSGRAEPNARIVLRPDFGPALAVSADPAGIWVLTLRRPGRDVLYEMSIQVGEAAVPDRGRLLVPGQADAPIVRLVDGGGSRRLDGALGLDSVEGDGVQLRVSGRARPRSTVAVDFGQGSRDVLTDQAGNWSVVLPPSVSGPIALSVDDAVFDVPSAPTATTGPGRAGAGWMLAWEIDGRGRQWTWLPDRR